MKKFMIAGALAGLGFALSMGSAMADGEASESNDFEASCQAYVDAYDRQELDCSCLAGKAEEDPSLLEEFAKVQTPEDADLMNDAAKEAAGICTAAG